MAWSAGAVLTAAQLNVFLPQDWVAWSPTITSESGSGMTTSITSARYTKMGHTLHWKLNLTITAAGTGAGAVRFTLPSAAGATGDYIGNGRSASSGKALQVFANATTQGSVLTYDNVSPITTSHVLLLAGTYEAA